jgi:hypothetical protein
MLAAGMRCFVTGALTTKPKLEPGHLGERSVVMSARNVLAFAILGLVGAIGSANAVAITATDVTIWDGATPGANSNSASQQGLPTATGLFGGPLPLILARTSFTAPINFNDLAGNTIPGFFASDSPPQTLANCTGACATNPLSQGNFEFATVFRFAFTIAVAETLSITHDDGISLFLAGTENTTNSNNLLPLSAASPTTAQLTTITIGPGSYDLWYAEVNGLPAVLQVDGVAVPGPVVGAGLPGLIAACGGLLGLARRRRKTV